MDSAGDPGKAAGRALAESAYRERLMKTTMYCAVAALALLAAPASAQSFAQLHHARGTLPPLTETGGLVNFDGTVLGGHGFTIVHNKRGVYTITYPSGAWSAFPATTCSPAGVFGNHITTCDVFASEGDATETTVIHIYNVANGKLVDNAFSFTAVLSH